jgi:hypothetical protein
MPQQRPGEPAVLLDLGRVARGVVGHPVEHGDPRPGAALDRRGQADVVEVVMRGQQQLEVLDPQARAAQPVLERRQGGIVARPGVDQRHGIAWQQPRVHGPDVRQRKGDGNHIRHELSSV